MNNIFNADQDTFTVVVSVDGGISTIAHSAKNYQQREFLTEMKFLPTWPEHEQIKPSKLNRMPYKRQITQYILSKFGPPDQKSLSQQIGGKWTKGPKGAMFKLNEHTIKEWIMACVVSQMNDRINGKFAGSTFTYQSNSLNFNARWDYEANKFVHA